MRILTTSTTNVPQYAQGLSVHNPQARTSSITARIRGNHPKRTLLILPVGMLLVTLEMPPIMPIMAEMNSKMAMIVIPSGRLRAARVTCCILSSHRETARSTVDTKENDAYANFVSAPPFLKVLRLTSSKLEAFNSLNMCTGQTINFGCTGYVRHPFQKEL